jgi:HD-GYP domain-containing protein (c-di-GMP phosphodiesterase class II)
MHVYETDHILEDIDGLEEIVHWAASHHEKLNGTGYPYKEDASSITLPSRILAVSDVFQALVQDRPYRELLSLEKIFLVMDDMLDKGELDPQVIKVLKTNQEYFYQIASQ